MNFLSDYANGDLDHHGQRPRKTWRRAIAAWAIEHLTLSAIIIFLAGPMMALPMAVGLWIYLLNAVVQEAEIRAEQRGRDKQVVITLSQTDKHCIEWQEHGGAWRCVAR